MQDVDDLLRDGLLLAIARGRHLCCWGLGAERDLCRCWHGRMLNAMRLL